MKEKTSGQKMLLTAGFMAMATLLSKVLGLVRDSLLTAYFGSGLESDAFLTASTIPTTLFDVIIGGVICGIYTCFQRYNVEKRQRRGDEICQ